MAQRALLVVLGLPMAAFALWGSWEMARQVPHAPQALLGSLAFVVIGLIVIAATVLGVRTPRG